MYLSAGTATTKYGDRYLIESKIMMLDGIGMGNGHQQTLSNTENAHSLTFHSFDKNTRKRHVANGTGIFADLQTKSH